MKYAFYVFFFIIAFFHVSPCYGTVYTFTGNGNWEDEVFWDTYPGTLLTSGDTVIISSGSVCDSTATFELLIGDEVTIINEGYLVLPELYFSQFIFNTSIINHDSLIIGRINESGFGDVVIYNDHYLMFISIEFPPILKTMSVSPQITNYGLLHFNGVEYDFSNLGSGIITNYDSISFDYSDIRITGIVNYGSFSFRGSCNLQTSLGNFGFFTDASDGGSITLEEGPIVNYGRMNDSFSPGLIRIQGTFSNFGTINSGLSLSNSSTISAYMQSSGGNITLDISGDQSSEYERVNFGTHFISPVNFDGSININLVDYIPLVGDSFSIIGWSSNPAIDTSITADMIDLSKLTFIFPELDSCKSWKLHYHDNGILTSVIASPDTDNDGTVDCDDLCPNDSLKTDPGICGCGVPELDSDGDGKPDCLDSDVTFVRQSNSRLEGVRISGQTADSTQLWYLGSVTDTDSSVMFMNRRDDALQFGTDNTLQMTLDNEGKLGIGRTPGQYRLEVNGQASKSTPGDWLANSDARLKRNILPLDPATTLHQLLALNGVTYEWGDRGDYNRPEGIQFGLTAQNVQGVFPSLVQEGKDGWLVTSYGTFDPMFLAAIRALNNEVAMMRSTMSLLKSRLDKYEVAKHSSTVPKTDEN